MKVIPYKQTTHLHDQQRMYQRVRTCSVMPGPQAKAMAVARAPLHQNLNSGSLRVNGLTPSCNTKVLIFRTWDAKLLSFFDSKKPTYIPLILSLAKWSLLFLDPRPHFQQVFQFWSCQDVNPGGWQETKSRWKDWAYRFQDHTSAGTDEMSENSTCNKNPWKISLTLSLPWYKAIIKPRAV